MGVAGRKRDPGPQRHGQAQAVDRRQVQGLARVPRGRQGVHRQAQHRHDRQDRDRQGIARRQAGAGEGDRGDDQQGEGVGDAAGEIEQADQLQDVEAELGRGLPVSRRAAADGRHGEQQVEPGADPDDDRAGQVRRGELQHLGDDHQGDGLTRQRQPAQGDQGAGAKPAGTARNHGGGGLRGRGRRRIRTRLAGARARVRPGSRRCGGRLNG